MVLEFREQIPLAQGVNDSSVGAVAWANASNTALIDFKFATVVLDTGQQSNYLIISSLGFTVEDAARITGIGATIVNSVSVGNSVSDASLFLVVGGIVQTSSTNQANPALWNQSVTTNTYGGVTNLWGANLTPADARSPGFGLALSCINSNAVADTAGVDLFSMQLFFNHEIPNNTTSLSGFF